MSPLLNPQSWQVPHSHLRELLDGTSRSRAVTQLALAVQKDRALADEFARNLAMEVGRMSSAFLAPSDTAEYLGLEVLDAIERADVRVRCLREVILTSSPLLPLDMRAAALQRYDEAGGARGDLLSSWRKATASLPSVLGQVDLLHRDSDGIDHTFDVPLDAADFADLLLESAQIYQAHRVAMLLQRERVERDTPEHPLAQGISRHLADSLLDPADFLVPWDRPIVRRDGSVLTVAEVAKALLLHPAAKLPLTSLRRATVAFYRAVFGIGGRSVVGLGSGFLYVEHGSQALPSYVYVGQGAIIGKGVTIDTVGGVVLGPESFIGGGFIPLLVHTHKHLRGAGESAAAERLRITRTAFVAEAEARLPLGTIGLLECADHIDDPLPYPGIRVVPVDNTVLEEG